MKKLIVIFGLMLLPLLAIAQRTPHYNMNFGNAYSIMGLKSLGINMYTPLHNISISNSVSSNLNCFNFVNVNLNKNISSLTQARDTSSFSLYFTYTGSPILKLVGKTGNNLVRVDSSALTVGVPMMMYIGDTTVAARYGVIVFKTSDSTYYGCKYIRPTGKKKWFKLDN